MSWLGLLNMFGDLPLYPAQVVTISHSIPTPSTVLGPVSGFAPIVEVQHFVQDSYGVSEDVLVTFEFPIQHRSYRNFTFDINVSDITGLNVLSFEFSFSYPIDLVEIVSVNPAGITEGKSLSVNTSTPGVVQVAFADAIALTGSGQLLEVEMYTKTVLLLNEVGNLTWNSFQFNEGTPTSNAQPSNLVIIQNPAIAPTVTHQAFPPENNNIIAQVASLEYVVPRSEPIIDGQGFSVPPVLTYETFDSTGITSDISVSVSVATITHDVPSPSSGMEAIVGVSSIATVVHTVNDSDAPNVGEVEVATLTYTALTPTELSFGDPRSVRLDSFGAYSARLSVFPKIRDGIINTNEDIIFKCILRDSDGEVVSLGQNSSLYFFVLKPDDNVEGGFVATEVQTGYYEYEYTPTDDGIYWLRANDPGNNVIEEKKFVVKDSLVTV